MDVTSTPPGPREPSFSCAQVAETVEVDRGTVRRWARGGLIDYWETPTGRIRIPESQLAAIVTLRKGVSR